MWYCSHDKLDWLASLFAASTTDRKALLSYCAYIVRPTRRNVVTTSHDSLMTSCDDVTSRRRYSVSSRLWYLVSSTRTVSSLTLIFTSYAMLSFNITNNYCSKMAENIILEVTLVTTQEIKQQGWLAFFFNFEAKLVISVVKLAWRIFWLYATKHFISAI